MRLVVTLTEQVYSVAMVIMELTSKLALFVVFVSILRLVTADTVMNVAGLFKMAMPVAAMLFLRMGYAVLLWVRCRAPCGSFFKSCRLRRSSL